MGRSEDELHEMGMSKGSSVDNQGFIPDKSGKDERDGGTLFSPGSSRTGRVSPDLPKEPYDEESEDTDLTFGTAWVNYTQSTSIHGLTFFYDTTPFCMRRLIWVMVFLGCLSFLIYSLVFNVLIYLSYPKSIDVTMTTEKEKKFPAVTICNMNSFRLSQAVNLNWFKTIDEIFGDNIPPSNETMDSLNMTTTVAPAMNGTNITTLMAECQRYNESAGESMTSLTMRELYDCLGQELDELILKCTWGTKDCDIDSDFRKVLTDAGSCFTFNPNETKQSTSTGTAQGVSLLLNVESYESMSGPAMSSGVRVMLHTSQESNPLIKELGYSVSSGTHTTFAITSDIETRVAPPYGECRSTWKKNNVDLPYSESQCRRECDLKVMVDICGCIEAFMRDIADEDYKTCDLKDAGECTTPNEVELREAASNCKAQCVVPCSSSIFNPVYSFSALTFVRATKLINATVRNELIGRQRLAKDFASKVRSIWFEPDEEIIDKLVEDFEAFELSLAAFLTLAKSTATTISTETECLDKVRAETESATVEAKHAADDGFNSLLVEIETAQGERISLGQKDIMTVIGGYKYQQSSFSPAISEQDNLDTFEGEREQKVTDLGTAAATANLETEKLLNLSALSTQLQMSITTQAETIKALNENLNKLNDATDIVGTLVDKAQFYVDGKNETHPPTYLKTDMAGDFGSNQSSLELQRLSLNMGRMQSSLDSFLAQNLIFQSVRDVMCSGLLECKTCTFQPKSITDDLGVKFVEAQTNLKAFQVIMDKFQSRLRDYKDSIRFTEDFVRRNILQVDIYYRGLSTTEIQQKRIYEIKDLFSDFGGLMGLCIGASLISILEIFDFFLHFAFKKCC